MKTAVASVVAATAASACCIAPVALVMIGVGAAGATFSSLEPYRPAMLGAAALLLGVAFRAAYRPLGECDACSQSSRRRAKRAAWIAAALVVGLATFPYYVSFLF